MPNSPRIPRKAKPRAPSTALGSEADQLLRVIAETAADAIITIDERSIILFANPAAERIFGYRISEMLGQEVTTLMPTYLREVHRAALRRYLETGQKHTAWSALDLTGLHKSGREIPLEISLSDHAHDGKRTFTGIVRDLSDRARTDMQLRQTEEKYARMIQSSPDAITLRTLPDCRYLEVNPGFTRLTGYASEEVIGKTSAGLNLLVDSQMHGEMLRKLEQEGNVHEEEFRFRTKAGEIRSARVSATRVTVGGRPCMLSITHDITERKRAEESLQQSESHFRSLVQDAPYGIYRVALDGKILAANPALVDMLGYDSEADLIDRNMGTEIYKDPATRQRLIDEYWTKKEFKDVEVEWKRRDGKVIKVRLSGRALGDQQGKLSCFEVFAEDVTERRVLERQLLQSQKMEAIGRLAGGIAHDFNNLLGVILGHSEILDESGLSAHLRKSTTAIQNAAERAAALTMQLLAFSRKQIIEPRIIDINASVGEIEKLLHRVIGEDIELITRLQPHLACVRMDPGQFDQVLMNLVVNARDVMPSGGKLIIGTANAELDETYVRQHLGATTGPFVMLAVSDTGTGMDSETLSHIFEPFFTTKEKGKGTGLGLSTVYGIVKQSGGYIMAYSEPSHGSTFKIYFPRAEGTPAVRGQRADRDEIPRGTETILVVEDEPALRELTRGLLEDSGYTVLEAAGVKEAIETVRRDGDTKIHLLLTDVVMPGMGGHELAEQLLRIIPGLRILYMSGYTDDVVADRGVLTQGTLLIQKPFTKSALLRKVRGALDSTL